MSFWFVISLTFLSAGQLISITRMVSPSSHTISGLLALTALLLTGTNWFQISFPPPTFVTAVGLCCQWAVVLSPSLPYFLSIAQCIALHSVSCLVTYLLKLKQLHPLVR